jgi:hypothetical protein
LNGDISLDGREVRRLIEAAATPREELIIRLALHRLCKRLWHNRRFRKRISELTNDIPLREVEVVLADVARIEASLRIKLTKGST